MPTIFSVFGLRFLFFSDDHEPIHIHVAKGKGSIDEKVWVDDTAVYIQTIDGKIFSRLFADFPLLRNATPAQRANFQWGKIGIRWESIDEDLNYAGFFNPAKNPCWI